MPRIMPSPGRVVWFRASSSDPAYDHDPAPLAAHVAAVNPDGTINLMVIGRNGQPFARERIKLWQDDEPAMVQGSLNYAEWMPFQLGQARAGGGMENTSRAAGPAAVRDPSNIGETQFPASDRIAVDTAISGADTSRGQTVAEQVGVRPAVPTDAKPYTSPAERDVSREAQAAREKRAEEVKQADRERSDQAGA